MGEPLARRLLRYDAGYCLGSGVLVLVLAPPLSRLFHLPTLVLAVVGLATVGWALLVALLARREDWKRSLRAVASANVFATAALAGLATVAPALAAKALLAAVAVEVAAFAAGQLAALRR